MSATLDTSAPSASHSETVLHEQLRDITARAIDSTDDGLAELKSLVESAPEFTDALGHYAWALSRQGQHEAAIAVYQQIASRQPDNPEPLWRIADRLVNLRRLDDALAQYQRVLERWPDCMDAKMGVRYIKHLQRAGSKEQQPYVPSKQTLTELQRINAELNDAEFQSRKLRMRSMPTDLYLESTTKCNFYCKTCSKGYDAYYAEDLQNGIFERVKAEVMPTVTRISITGFGEPTMAGNFDQILGMAMDGASTVHFVTNASLLNFDRIGRLTRLPVHITISMDGATKETFEAIRAGGNFDLILEKLAMIKKMRDINLSDMRSHFCFNFVALRRNIHELPDLIRLAHRFNIPKVHVADYAFNNNEFDEQSLRYEPLKGNQYLHEALDLARELGIPIVLPPDYEQTPPPARGSSLLQRVLSTQRIFPKRDRFPARCSSPWKEPYVRTDGLVTPCCSSGQKLGHLQHATFAQVWNGWRYRMLRWRIESVMPPLPCRKCFVSWGINGGNPGNVMAQEGLIIKALYWLEIRARHYARRLINYIRSLRDTHPAPPAQQPNFKLGRPWKPTPQKQPQP